MFLYKKNKISKEHSEILFQSYKESQIINKEKNKDALDYLLEFPDNTIDLFLGSGYSSFIAINNERRHLGFEANEGFINTIHANNHIEAVERMRNLLANIQEQNSSIIAGNTRSGKTSSFIRGIADTPGSTSGLSLVNLSEDATSNDKE